jgi:hypothetical protein
MTPRELNNFRGNLRIDKMIQMALFRVNISKEIALENCTVVEPKIHSLISSFLYSGTPKSVTPNITTVPESETVAIHNGIPSA